MKESSMYIVINDGCSLALVKMAKKIGVYDQINQNEVAQGYTKLYVCIKKYFHQLTKWNLISLVWKRYVLISLEYASKY